MFKSAAAPSTNLCPFSWHAVSRPAGCLGALTGGLFGGTEIVHKPEPCLGDGCKLWNRPTGDCVLNQLGK